MRFIRILIVGLVATLATGAAGPAQSEPKFQDCPLLGPIENYSAVAQPEWLNWDEASFVAAKDDGEEERTVAGAVCTQNYAEKDGVTTGSILEIIENYKQALTQLGATLQVVHDGYVSAHLTRDGKEYWIKVSATRDDGFQVQEVLVAPFKRSLLPPSGNDFRLLGHMPGAVAAPPVKKNFEQFGFPTTDGEVVIKGAYYDVTYAGPDIQAPARKITPREVVANYRAALQDLNAEILLDNPDTVTARLDDHGQIVWVRATENRVVAIDEKPFKLSIQPPTSDAMKDQLDKAGHIALYVNFDFDKATLKPDAAPVVSQIVDLLRRNPGLKVEIDGHTDAIGPHDYNAKLSQDRAASVVAAIVAGGIDASRLQSAGFGPDQPIAPNDTDEGRAKNRRVELVKAP